MLNEYAISCTYLEGSKGLVNNPPTTSKSGNKINIISTDNLSQIRNHCLQICPKDVVKNIKSIVKIIYYPNIFQIFVRNRKRAVLIVSLELTVSLLRYLQCILISYSYS